jgi:hypothetical protein
VVVNFAIRESGFGKRGRLKECHIVLHPPEKFGCRNPAAKAYFALFFQQVTRHAGWDPVTFCGKVEN